MQVLFILLLMLASAFPGGQCTISELCSKKDTGQDIGGLVDRIKCLGTPKNRIITIAQLQLSEIALEITLL